MKISFAIMLLIFAFPAISQHVEPIQNPYDINLVDGYRPLYHQRNANRILGSWSILSIGTGGYQLLSPNPFVKAMGLQNLIWGAVDGGIALYGSHQLNSTNWNGRDLQKEREKFRKILLVNSILDVGYLVLGVALFKANNSKWHGHGQGILIQGGFLLLFDGVNYALTF